MTAPSLASEARRDIAGLDGLRAVSISFVLISHLLLVTHAPVWLVPIRQLGLFGVQVFFVISGYLITMLLVREIERTGKISLRGFIWRRVTRIIPAYAVYLILIWLILPAPASVRWWPALTYTSNVLSTNWWLTGHTWSLSVEEQFYLTWPAILWLLGPRRARWVALAVFLSGPLGRVICYLLTRDGWLALSWDHDFIAAGALLALLRPRGFRPPVPWLWPLVGIALCATFSRAMHWLFAVELTVSLPLAAIAIAMTLAWCLSTPDGKFVRTLELRPIKWLGIISYSVYLWQQPFTWEGSPFGPATAVACTLFLATLSYYVIERPGIALRKLLPELLRSRSRALAGDVHEPAS